MDEREELETLQANSGPLNEKIGLKWLEAGPDRVRARFPVEGNTQPQGVLHGGASAIVAETLGSVGAWLNDTSKQVLGMEVKTNHLRPASDGWLTATGKVLHRGRSTQLWEVRIVDEQDRLVAFSTVALAIRDFGNPDT